MGCETLARLPAGLVLEGGGIGPGKEELARRPDQNALSGARWTSLTVARRSSSSSPLSRFRGGFASVRIPSGPAVSNCNVLIKTSVPCGCGRQLSLPSGSKNGPKSCFAAHHVFVGFGRPLQRKD